MPIPAPINPYHQAPLAKRPFNKRSITRAYLVSGSLFHVCYPPPEDILCIAVNEDIHFINDTMLITKSGSEVTPDDISMQYFSSIYLVQISLDAAIGISCYDTLIHYDGAGACPFYSAASFEQETACFSGVNQDSVNFNVFSIFYQASNNGCGVDSFIYAASGVRIN